MVYFVDGLYDGDNSWYQSQFVVFIKVMGIKVQYVEGGFGVIVECLVKECINLQVDVLVMVLLFIQCVVKE